MTLDLAVDAIANVTTETISVNQIKTIATATFQLTEKIKNVTLSIFNIYGQKIKQLGNLTGDKIETDRHNLNAGLYFFTIQDNKNIFNGKFVVE